jgi:alpha-glucoside transport system substrate-binding protein
MIRSQKATLLVGLAAVATAIGGGAGSVLAQSPAASGGAAGATGYAELDQAMGADKPFAGTKVDIKTQWVQEGPDFAAAVKPFEDATGITVNNIALPSGQHESQLLLDIQGGTPPDLAALAQPSAVLDYGAQGKLIDLNTILDGQRLATEHPSTIGFYTADGHAWAIPYKLAVKSLVWYPIKAFADKGYEIPKTWDELIALSDKIVADGSNPWCVGIGADAATGWIVTDWVEDLLLRTAGIDAYNRFITNDLKFSSPEVKKALELTGKIFFTDGYVWGGVENIVPTNQNDAMDPMFADGGPQCWMQKQADWYLPVDFPDVKAGAATSKWVVGEDYGFFYFPPVDPSDPVMGAPALGAGDGIMMFNDRPEVRALAQFLASPEGIKGWIDNGSAISANFTTPAEWYAPSYKLTTESQIVQNATSFGFDASDLQPPAVGQGSFWHGMVDWIGAKGANADDVLATIDASWPTK